MDALQALTEPSTPLYRLVPRLTCHRCHEEPSKVLLTNGHEHTMRDVPVIRLELLSRANGSPPVLG